MSDESIHPLRGIPREAYKLCRQLLEKADKTEEGYFWVFDTPGYDGEVRQAFSPNLADGSAGIVATLLNAYATTGNEEFLEAAREGIRYLLHYLKNTDMPNLGLYRGLGGTALVCAHYTRLTGDIEYARKAMYNLSPRVDSFLSSPYTNHSLLNGRAGALLAFTHLVAATGDEEGWAPAYAIANDLLKKSRSGTDGLYWRPYYPEIQPLCGLAEGNAGIAWAFAELARLSGQEAWFVPAEMALEYEISCMQQDRTPDYRRGIRTAGEHLEQVQRYRDGDMAFFNTPSFHGGWGYGDTGTVLAWQRIAKISPSEQYAPAFPETKGEDKPYYNDLLPAKLSQAIAYYHAALILDDGRPLQQTRALGVNCLDTLPPDDLRLLGGMPGVINVLFMGNAPTRVFDYFFPIPKEIHPVPGPEKSATAIRKLILNQVFRRTISLLEHLEPSLMPGYLQQQHSTAAEVPFFREYVAEYLGAHREDHLAPVREVFDLEKLVLDTSTGVESYTLRNAREIVRQEEAEPILNLSDEAFAQTPLVLNPDVQVVTTRRDWSKRWHAGQQRAVEPPELLRMEPEMTHIMIRPNATGSSVLENTLNQLSYFTCEAFGQTRTLSQAVELFKDTFEIQNEAQMQQVARMLREQTREFFNTGILLLA